MSKEAGKKVGGKPDIKSLESSELEEFIVSMGEKPYRAKQIEKWLLRGARSFYDMTDLALELRKRLDESATLHSLKIEEIRRSSEEGTSKYLFGLPDGEWVESVFLRYSYGNTVCVSSQVGCRMGCKFCASTIGGLVRDLRAWEMSEQIVRISEQEGLPVSHAVIMGIGEPFDNYGEVSKFLKRMHSEPFGMSYRNMTVSTCGIVPEILKLAEDFPAVTLAVSLHAHNDSARNVIMPISKTYGLDELLDACRRHAGITGRRTTFEYALIKGVNDSKEDAEALAKLLSGLLCHVNLIPLNPVDETGFEGADREAARRFAEILNGRGVPATVRRQLGAGIDAACGQLRRKLSPGTPSQ